MNMIALDEQNTESTAIDKSNAFSYYWGMDFDAWKQIPTPAKCFIRTLPPSRREKILSIRRQIAEGTYDLNVRLNIVLDRLLRDHIG